MAAGSRGPYKAAYRDIVNRVCPTCGIEKDLETGYYNKKNRPGGKDYECKECRKKQYAKWLDTVGGRKHTTAQKRQIIYNKYGLGKEGYEQLLKDQDNKCACCSVVMRKPVIDHNHISGKVRGLLCSRCNTGIGQLGDTLEGLLQAVEYLQRIGD